MATQLKKPVHREANRVRATKNGRIESAGSSDFMPMGAKPVIVSLLPNDCFQWRVKGTKTVYTAHLSTIMSIAQAVTIYDDYQRKLERKKLEKSAGYRVRKVRKPGNPPLASMLRKLHGAIC